MAEVHLSIYDVHKIINDAMLQRDRTVNIYICAHGTSVFISPIRTEDEPHWIVNNRGQFTCSNCGHVARNNITTTYCPDCGELLHGLGIEKENKDD